MTTALIVAAAILCAVSGGVFYAFSTFVMGALGRLDRAEGVRAMQSINVVVINPVFFAVFFGAALVAIATVVTSFVTGDPAGRFVLIGGAAAYVLGCIGVTVGGNVPLNDRLAAVDAEAPEAEAMWAAYLDRWTAWNHVRTLFCVVAAVAFAVAAVLR